MKTFDQAFEEVKGLFDSVIGQPAPEISPESFAAFPTGVDPLQHALFEVECVKQLCERVRRAPRAISWMPAADCFATPETLVVRLEVPGVSREDLKVSVAEEELIVSGERKPPLMSPELRPVSLERAWGAFERRFPLPTRSQSQGIEAKYADGILEVRIPIEQPAAVEPRAVSVA
jgi:HSP20 family protein